MQRLKNLRISRYLLIMCFASYAITTTVKMCVPTVIASMVSEGYLSKGQSGLLSGIFYLVYGAGQLVFGSYFSRHSPYMGVKLALVGSALCCVLMSTTDNFCLLLLIWCICAVFNAGFFPAVMNINSMILAEKHSLVASKYFSIAYQGGYMICLLAGSVIMSFFDWRKLYYFSAAAAVLVFAFWWMAEIFAKRSLKADGADLSGQARACNVPLNIPEKKKKSLISYFGTGLFFFFAVALLNALLNNGVKSWAPTIIMETYHTSPAFSTLLNVLILIINVATLLVVGALVRPGRVRPSIVMLFISLPILIIMHFTGVLNEYIYAVLLGVFTSLTACISNNTAVQIPYRFASRGDVARVSGTVNMCASFGVLIGSYGYGFLAERYGWRIVMNLWVVLAVVCIILLFIAQPLWKKFCEKRD